MPPGVIPSMMKFSYDLLNVMKVDRLMKIFIGGKNQTAAINGKISGFDGLRGIAAVFVVLTHLGLLSWLKKYNLQQFWPLINGNAGVTCFYVLSGFLITRILFKEFAKFGRVNIKHFLIKRALRLYPLYYLVMFIILIFGIIGLRSVSIKSYLYAAFYCYNFIPTKDYDTWLGSFHTLATEEQFYIVYPIVLHFFKYNVKKLIILILIYLFMQPLLMDLLSDFSKQYSIGRWSIIAGHKIALGCLLALIFDAYPKLLNKISLMTLPGFLLIYMTLLFKLPGPIVDYLTTLAFGFLVSFTYLNQSSILVKALEIRPLRYLGRVSYGIYVWQSFFITTGSWKVKGWPLDYPLNILLLVIIVPISWHFFEKRFLNMKNKYNPT